jgi:hypothetical protein
MVRPTFMRSSRNSSQRIEAPEVTVAGLRHALTLLRFIRPGDRVRRRRGVRRANVP